jgi:hypothetical protein
VFGRIVKGQEVKPQLVSITTRAGSGVKLGLPKALDQIAKVDVIESTESAARLNISLAPDLQSGEVRSRVVVPLNGSERKSINIPIVAVIEGELKVSPPTLSFGVIDNGTIKKRSVKVEATGGTPVKIERIEAEHAALSTNLRTLQDGKEFMIEVEVDPAKLTKDLQSFIRVYTTSKEQQVITLNVYGIKPLQ